MVCQNSWLITFNGWLTDVRSRFVNHPLNTINSDLSKYTKGQLNYYSFCSFLTVILRLFTQTHENY